MHGQILCPDSHNAMYGKLKAAVEKKMSLTRNELPPPSVTAPDPPGDTTGSTIGKGATEAPGPRGSMPLLGGGIRSQNDAAEDACTLGPQTANEDPNKSATCVEARVDCTRVV